MSKLWRDVSSLYQIYPRSYQDTNNDGVGDLPGITSRLGYLSWLGIDAIWISPFFKSPMTDFGYDISNYREIDPVFGTMDDFTELLERAHRYDIKVMIDLVPCHTSDQHDWFKESRSSLDNPKRDYYVWRDPSADGGPPNNWRSLATGSSWTLDETTGQYYLHSFLPSQPDLNWDNPQVRQEMTDVVRFWYEKGVDGLRVDAIWGISKDLDLADDPINPDFHDDLEQYGSYIHNRCKYGPNFDNYLGELAAVNQEFDDRYMVFEFYPDEQLGNIYDQYSRVRSINSTTSAFFMEYRHNHWHASDTLGSIRAYLDREVNSTPFFCIGNHDQPRVSSRLGFERARALSFQNLTTPGVSVVYYGDEIGMENGNLSADDIQDTFSPSHTKFDSRDLERTPMQWNESEFAGFSESNPWLPVHADRECVNVVTQSVHDNSLLNMHRRLLHLRAELPVLRQGSLLPLDLNNGYVLAFERRLGNSKAFVLVNYADSAQHVILPELARPLVSTSRTNENEQSISELELGPYQAMLLLV